MDKQASLEPLLRTQSDKSPQAKTNGDHPAQEVAKTRTEKSAQVVKTRTEKSTEPSTKPTNDTRNSWDHPLSVEPTEHKWRSFLRQTIDLLTLCCLLTSATILWNFPRLLLSYGGFYFMFVYLFMLIAFTFPLLHLEIFVGQNCQAGIFKACRSFGPGYGGLGLAIIFASAVCSLRFIQNSYINFLHIRFLISEPEVLYSCRAQNADGRFRFYNCTSEYDTQWCKSNNFSKYYGGGCFNSSSLDRPTAVIGSVQRYYQYLVLAPNADFDLYRLFFTFSTYSLLAVLGSFGAKVLRIFLAAIYFIFIFLFIFVFFQFISIADFRIAYNTIVIASTPESMFNPKTYLFAFYLSMATSGLGLFGILCTCSFRDKNSGTLGLAYGVTFNNLLVSFMSVIIFLCVASALQGRYKLLGDGLSRAGYFFGMVATAEVFFLKGKSIGILVPYYCFVFLLTVLSFCGPLFTICALVRDNVQRRRQLWTVWGVTVFCLTTFLFSVPRSVTSIGILWENVIEGFYSYMIYFVEVVMVMVFVVIYGEREYAIDISQLYPIRNGYRPWSSPAHPIYLKMLNIVSTFLMILMAIHFATTVVPAITTRDRMHTNLTFALIGIVLTLILGFLAYSIYGNIKRNEGMDALFFVTPEHPSYWRITSLDVGVEEVGLSEE